MLAAIENLKAALRMVEESQKIFRREMAEADHSGDNQRANFCEDSANGMDLITRDLRSKISYMSEAANILYSRKK